jgi:flagellar biosynthesis protein FliR
MTIASLSAEIPVFMTVFVRITGCFVSVPFFNSVDLYVLAQVALSLILTLLVFPAVPHAAWVIPANLPSFVVLLGGEMLVGFSMGLVVNILIMVLQLTGHLLGFEMGLTMASVFDPQSGEQVELVSSFFLRAGIIMFLVAGGDHFIIQTLVHSFRLLPPGHVFVSAGAISLLVKFSQHAFIFALKLAAPLFAMLFMVDITMGMMSKTAQKMQIFFVTIPAKLMLGLFGFSLVIGSVLLFWSQEVAALPGHIAELFALMRS